jgi:FMN phosphatase YigB (HAD superfamily)
LSDLDELKPIDTVLVDLRGTLVLTPSVTVFVDEMVGQGVPGHLADDLQSRLTAELTNLSDMSEVLDWTAYAMGRLTRWLADSGQRFDESRARSEFDARYLHDSRPTVSPKTFAHFIRALSNTGKRVVVVADGPTQRERRLLAQSYGSAGAVVELVCSEALGVNKLSESFYLKALRRLSATPGRTVVIGDRLDKDIRPAAAVGCKTLLVGPARADRSAVTVESCLEGLLDH